MQRGHGFAQHQRPAAAGDDRQRIEAAGFRRRDPQVEFEHTAVGNTVVAGGIHPAGQRTHVVDTRRVGQERKHVPSLPMTARCGPDRTVTGCGSPSRSTNSIQTGFDAAGLRDYLTRAEELGFEGGWVLEQIIGEAPLLAPLELLAWAAACTERLRLGVAVLVSSLHDPLQLASAITAVDRLSHGRLDVGVAPGRRPPQVRRVRGGRRHVHQ